MTYTPAITVEVAFGLGPYDTVGGGDWVDISSYVTGISIYRGRPSEFDEFGPSTCTIELLSDDREFDPLNTSGTYYGDLVANVPIRVYATVSSTDYPVWRGFVDGWPQTYSASGAHANITIECTDAFKLLAERPLPDSHVAWLETFGTPDAWYRCDTVAGGVVPNDGATGRDGKIVAPITVVEPLVPVSVGALQIPEQTPAPDGYADSIEIRIGPATSNPFGAFYWSMSLVVQMAKREFRGLVNMQTAGAANGPLTLYVGSDGLAHFFITAGGANLFGDGVVDISDGLPHRLMLVRDYTQARLYEDGVFSTASSNASATSYYDGANGVIRVGRSGLGQSAVTYAAPQTVIDELMIWTGTAFDAAEVTQLDAQLVEGFSTVRPSGTAVTDLLDFVSWPAGLRAIDDGEVLVSPPANLLGGSALDILQNIAACEGGRLFVGTDGTITFHGRSRFVTETVENTVQYTFSDTAGDDVSVLDSTLSLTVDDRRTYDAAVVTRQGGVQQTSALSATPARTYSSSGLLLASDGQARSLAEWVTFRYGTPQPRSDAWAIYPETKAAMVVQCGALSPLKAMKVMCSRQARSMPRLLTMPWL